MDAVILYSSNGVKGIVKQVTNLSNITFNHKSGFVTTFVFGNNKYTHSLTLKGINGNAGTLNLGYYKETEVLKFLSTPGTSQPQALDLSKIADAVLHDTIKVSKLRIVAPYDDFCKLNIYNWDYDPAQDVLDVNGNIIFRSATPNKVDVPLVPVTPYLFYYKNISLITSSDFPDNRDDAAYSLALIACLISNIKKDIFPLFSQSTELSSYITAQNNEWETGDIFNQPTYEDILQYEESLVNFYNAAYSNQLLIANATEGLKLAWLASILSVSGLAVFPIDLKLALLSQIVDIMTSDYVNDSSSNPYIQIADLGSQIIVNVVDSITIDPTQSDYFLKQLLTTKYSGVNNSDKTLFETLYSNLSDNRIGHLTHNLINSTDERKQYIQSLYNIWKISKYNPYYNSPSYTQPANPTGIYPESFFIVNKSTYYNKTTAPAVLVYNSTSTTVTPYMTSFEYELSTNQVIASQVTKVTTDEDRTSTSTAQYGTYHLYQPLSLIGYTPDPLVHLPQTNCIPAFFLYYASDAREIANFDFGVLLITEMALNFAILGGLGEIGEFAALADTSEIAAAEVAAADASNAAELSYLSEISGISDARSLPANTPLVSWNTVVGVSRIVQFSAGSLSSITNYMVSAATTSDPQVIAFLKKLDVFLGLINLATLGVDVINQISVVVAARDIVDDATYLAADLSQTTRDEIEILADIQELVNEMNIKLDAIQITGTNTIKPRFAALNSKGQLAFYEDFHLVDNTDPRWERLNTEYETGRSLVDDWEEIQYRQDFRNDVEVLNAYRYFRINDSLIEHVVIGEFNKKGYLQGFHSRIAEQYGGRIDKVLTQPDVDGIYDANVSKVNADGVYIPKLDGKALRRNDMFPDEWDTIQRFKEEFAVAFTRKTFDTDTWNQWICIMSNGRKCVLCILGNTATYDATTIVKTAWPIK